MNLKEVVLCIVVSLITGGIIYTILEIRIKKMARKAHQDINRIFERNNNLAIRVDVLTGKITALEHKNVPK